MADLLPCPFCQSKANEIFGDWRTGRAHVVCIHCRAAVAAAWEPSKEQAIAAWNGARAAAPPEPLPEDVETLAAVLILSVKAGTDLRFIANNILADRQRAVDAEREKVAAWMLANSIPTGHGDTIEDLLAEMTGCVQRTVEAEREACAEIADHFYYDLDESSSHLQCAERIRARGAAREG